MQAKKARPSERRRTSHAVEPTTAEAWGPGLTIARRFKESSGAPIQPQVERATSRTTTVYTDESSAYNHVSDTGRAHHTVCHSRREYARDDEGDGVREVHCNTMEGIWTGLRNFLRPFRGVHKKYLAQYVAVFEWAHNLKTSTATFLRLVMGGSISNPI